ncbi:hypothetical protein B6N31_00635 [Dickeya fangzhongdai]|uniref:hypothetical protein n=1 Tax=Dickeya fangzhongdai TaxID=1778540 RepID=UPI000EACB3C4|nr:hypothetical protein [Dickeya fangzhongdai]AYH46335.1 hypothetical protein B6N31_00635 [Dickeya fangzhongdai]
MSYNINKRRIRFRITIILLFLYAPHGFSVFSEKKNSELIKINTKAKNDKVIVIKKLDKSIKKTIEDNPEKANLIIDLKKSWDLTIEKNADLRLSSLKEPTQK